MYTGSIPVVASLAPPAMFVLVRSLLVGPATWRPTADALRARGHAAVVPARSAEPPLWPRAREAVARAAASLDGPLVLAGHSGAGVLLPALAAALPRPPAATVFVDAFLPPPDGSAPLVGDEQRRRPGRRASTGGPSPRSPGPTTCRSPRSRTPPPTPWWALCARRPARERRRQAGRWQTASRLLPSGSSTNAA